MRVYLFACIEKNIGDDLFIKTLCTRYPKVEFVISSDAKYGSLESIPNLIFSKDLARWIWSTSLNPHNPIKRWLARVLCFLCNISLPQYDMGIGIVGNAFKNISYTGWDQSYWIRARIALVKRFYLLSTNFGPYADERWKEDFDRIYPTMADVCFRDKASYELFSSHLNTRYAPDAVISLGLQPHHDPTHKRVIISLIDCSLRQRSKKLNKAAVSYESKMAAVARRFLSEGYNVTFLNSQTEQDRPACDRVLNQLDSPNIEVIDYDGNLEPIFELYRNSSCVVATRLHTIVLAWLHDIPVVPIVYDIKVENLLKTCRFTEKQYDICCLEGISGDEIYDAMRQYDFTLSQEIIEASQLQFREIDKALSENGV